MKLEYFYFLLHASQPASALAGIRKITTVQATVSVGALRSVPACSAGRRKERRDKAAFRSAHQSGIHTGISQFHRRSQKVMSQKLYILELILFMLRQKVLPPQQDWLELAFEEKCQRGQALFCSPYMHSLYQQKASVRSYDLYSHSEWVIVDLL